MILSTMKSVVSGWSRELVSAEALWLQVYSRMYLLFDDVGKALLDVWDLERFRCTGKHDGLTIPCTLSWPLNTTPHTHTHTHTHTSLILSTVLMHQRVSAYIP